MDPEELRKDGQEKTSGWDTWILRKIHTSLIPKKDTSLQPITDKVQKMLFSALLIVVQGELPL